MSTYEYRVVIKREGCRVKYRRYVTERAARRFLTLLGPEPWVAWGGQPGDAVCHCGFGAQCVCGAETVKQESDRKRRDMPALEFARLERRPAPFAWEPAP